MPYAIRQRISAYESNKHADDEEQQHLYYVGLPKFIILLERKKHSKVQKSMPRGQEKDT